MANKTLKARLRQASKTEAEWKSSNPVLLKGEVAYSSDKKQSKTGDGTSKWTELAYDSAVPTEHEHDLNAMIDKLGTTTSVPSDNDYYVAHVSGGDGYIRRTTGGLWEYIKSKANSVYTKIEDFNLLKNTVTDNTKVVNRVKNGINSIINSDSAISVNPSINGMGYAIHRGGSGCVKFDGFELPIYNEALERLFDGKSSTYIQFESLTSYCDVTKMEWSSEKQYSKGDFVLLFNNGKTNSFLMFKALSDNTGKNPLENPSIWYDNYRLSSNTYDGTVTLRKVLIQLEVVLPEVADWETGYSIYFRTAVQTVRDLVVEAGDINKENWQTEGSIPGICDPVVTIYPTKFMNGKKRSIRLSFYNHHDNTTWTAITQIALTGLVGGLEGTVLNKGGGELYGTVKPYQNNSVDLGTSSQKWSNVYSNTFIGKLFGNASSATKLSTARKINGVAFDGTKDIDNVIYKTKAEYDALVKAGTFDKNAMYVTTDETDGVTESETKLWNISSSLAQQGKYLSYSDQDGGKYLSLMNASDNTAVAHAKLMDGESGEGMDVNADKVKTVDSKGILVEALGETTAQALIDEVAKRVLDLSKETTNLTGRMESAENSITSLNSNIPVLRKIWFDDTSASDIKDLLKAKCRLIQKNKLGDGLYIITGGWSGQNFGFTIGQKQGGTIRIAFFDFYNIYQATSSTDDSLSNFAAASVKFTTI